MIEIKQIEKKEEISALIGQFSLTAAADGIFCAMTDGGTLCGCGSLCLRGAKVYLSDVCLSEEYDCDAMRLSLARAVLNLADLRGIKTVYAANEKLFGLCRLLRFKEDGGELFLSLEGYFTAHCSN